MSKDQARHIAMLLKRAIESDSDGDDVDNGVDRDHAPKQRLSKEMAARVLKDMGEIATRPNPFQIGDIIQIQKERNIYKLPSKAHHGLAIVCEVFDRSKQDTAPRTADVNAYCTNDLCILVQADVGWVQLLVDSWRFEKYDGEIEE